MSIFVFDRSTRLDPRLRCEAGCDCQPGSLQRAVRPYRTRPPVSSAFGTSTVLDRTGVGTQIDLVINVPRQYDAVGRPDGFLIRRAAVGAGVPLIADLQLARAVIEASASTKTRRSTHSILGEIRAA